MKSQNQRAAKHGIDLMTELAVFVERQRQKDRINRKSMTELSAIATELSRRVTALETANSTESRQNSRTEFDRIRQNSKK